jgi:hypothetical protein
LVAPLVEWAGSVTGVGIKVVPRRETPETGTEAFELSVRSAVICGRWASAAGSGNFGPPTLKSRRDSSLSR